MKVKDKFSKSIMLQVDENEWKVFKELSIKNNQNAHIILRECIKNYIKRYGTQRIDTGN